MYYFKCLVLTAATTTKIKVYKDIKELWSTHNGKKALIEIVPEEAQTLYLLGKDFKSNLNLNVLKD